MTVTLEENTVIAVDPGREKCGIAVVASIRGVLCQEVVAVKELAARVGRLIETHQPTVVLLGNGTGHTAMVQELKPVLTAAGGEREIPLLLVDEYGTTEEARRFYWRENPPRGWRRWVPLGLLTPPTPLDGYVAVLLAARFFASATAENKKNKKNK